MADAADKAPLMEVSDIEVHFGGVKALSGVSFDVGAGEIVGLIGPNGAGKTTMFNVITGFVKAREGKVRFDGDDITRWPSERIAAAGLARTFQGAAVFPEMTIEEALLVATRERVRREVGLGRGAARKAISEGVESVFERVPGIAPLRRTVCGDLPHGTRRLVSVAMALCVGPSLLLLDEPLAGIGSDDVDRVLELCVELRDQGLALLFVEHNVGAVMDVCDRIVVLDFGRKIADAEPEQVKEDEKVIQAYLGLAAEEGGNDV